MYPWGSEVCKITPDNQVMQFGFKDLAFVIFQSTYFEGNETRDNVERRRPKKSAKKHKTAREPFGDQHTKVLPIPKYVNSYNHNMNHVDRADQLRASYPAGTHKTLYAWKALFFYLLNTTLVNCFLLSLHSGAPNRYTSHLAFQEDLYLALFTRSERRNKRTVNPIAPPGQYIPQEHELVHMQKQSDCQGCRRANSSKKRKSLGEIDVNITTKWPKRSNYGCMTCHVHICKEGPCWEVYHSPPN